MYYGSFLIRMSSFAILLNVVVLLALVVGNNGNLEKKLRQPPHCTHVTKSTDYISKFRLDYPVAYVPPGQHEAYQQMYCVNPAGVNTAVTTVCDWVAPPQVHFTLGDEYMHVVRQDPTGRFQGNAVINTYQLCSHNFTQQSVTATQFCTSNELEQRTVC